MIVRKTASSREDECRLIYDSWSLRAIALVLVIMRVAWAHVFGVTVPYMLALIKLSVVTDVDSLVSYQLCELFWWAWIVASNLLDRQSLNDYRVTTSLNSSDQYHRIFSLLFLIRQLFVHSSLSSRNDRVYVYEASWYNMEVTTALHEGFLFLVGHQRLFGIAWVWWSNNGFRWKFDFVIIIIIIITFY